MLRKAALLALAAAAAGADASRPGQQEQEGVLQSNAVELDAMRSRSIEPLTLEFLKTLTFSPFTHAEYDKNTLQPFTPHTFPVGLGEHVHQKSVAGSKMLTDGGVDVHDQISRNKDFGAKFAHKLRSVAGNDGEVRKAMDEAIRRLEGGPIYVSSRKESASVKPTLPPRFAEERDNGDGGDVDQYHIVVRAFIPGADTKAAEGFVTSHGLLGVGRAVLQTRDKFSSKFQLPEKTHGAKPGFGGYVMGAVTMNEVFDSSHRDFSTSLDDNEHSKTHVHVHLKRAATGRGWAIENTATACSRTHHYSDHDVSFISKAGLICSKRAEAPEDPVRMFMSTEDHFAFTVKVRVGNPCVPGSYYAGPIMHTVTVHADFKSRTFDVIGHKSQFPAFEVLFGRDPENLHGLHYGIEGRNFYALMDDEVNIEERVNFV